MIQTDTFAVVRENLTRNHMTVHTAENKEEALRIAMSLVEEGNTVGLGGSMSLFEIGVVDALRAASVHLLDRYASGLTAQDIVQLHRECFQADVYMTSTNALTQAGELYNVDGSGNRVAAMLYGPKKVVVVVGSNKLCEDIIAARARVKTLAAPKNCVRLQRKTPCVQTGTCMDCDSVERICSFETIIKKQSVRDRIHVILVNEVLGY